MSDSPAFLTDPDGTQEAIMAATYLALCEYGYAGLTIQRIAERFEKSKSLLYHHYDNKDDLLLEFLGFVLDQFEEGVPSTESDDPVDRLEMVLDTMVPTELPDEHRDFVAAVVELRAQAAHDDRYREQFTDHDAFFETRVSDVIERGVESGAFREVDSDRFARLLQTMFVGAMTRRVTTDANLVEDVRAELDTHIEANLLAERTEAAE